MSSFWVASNCSMLIGAHGGGGAVDCHAGLAHDHAHGR
jgi:hypothetical protein